LSSFRSRWRPQAAGRRDKAAARMVTVSGLADAHSMGDAGNEELAPGPIWGHKARSMPIGYGEAIRGGYQSSMMLAVAARARPLACMLGTSCRAWWVVADDCAPEAGYRAQSQRPILPRRGFDFVGGMDPPSAGQDKDLLEASCGGRATPRRKWLRTVSSGRAYCRPTSSREVCCSREEE
jgi:hypothetical protein